MPHKENWEEIASKGSFEAYPEKWKHPLSIEYGYKNLSGVIFFCWRVQGTEHTFTIKFSELNEKSNGDVQKHVETFLESFRKEIVGWIVGGLSQPWMREYYEQYKHYIEFQ
jgi:hypothetical protein